MAAAENVDVGVGMSGAAHRVGVAAATLRAWERRYGLMPSGHTSGGHRRYSGDDIATLIKMRAMVEAGMPTASAAALTQSSRSLAHVNLDGGSSAEPAGEAYAQLAAAAQSLDAAELGRIARSVLAQRGVVAAWTGVFVPYLQGLGRRWAGTGVGVECEHVAVAVLQSVLRKDTSRRRGLGSRRAVLLAAASGEVHTLPLDALAAALAENGVASQVVYDLPAGALISAAARTPAGPVVLWARRAPSGGLALLHQVSQTRSPVYAAGPGWRADRLPTNVGHFRDLEEAVVALCVAGRR